MQEAWTKGMNKNMIKKTENEYLQYKYGILFSIYCEVDVSPILKYESFMISYI